ncbi:hypothetical protein TRFO_20558 [Tritrichomonas foetus]|uniref:Protein kinase domain-containing protein n=1 Tax=Tritrichomonas foetus TaxID=1144522 RepID=A0A1J4KGK4_9EUKA|nr:hypothetical protein TRFO_20558 [Tritrichomonas foetus]|eukprot:OHT10186.1 hypothetical protein TRFO_20558 [Tritrichomonas foetus]
MLISKSSGMTKKNESNLNDIQPVGNKKKSDDSAFDRISADIKKKQQLNELKILISHLKKKNYDFVRQIGKGAKKKIYLFYSRRYFEYFKKKCFSGKISDNLFCQKKKLDALINLNSPNVVRVYDYVISENVLYFIKKKCELGSMKDFIDHRKKKTGDTLLYVCFELQKKIQFIHVRNIAHLDKKKDNILIDKYGRVK